MGLCKCRVVTNLFCYQHKQSVCEKCITQTHQKCVIKSYIQWLQDSDFDPNCGYCKQPITDSTPVVRFTCLDLFHQTCVETYANSLPEHTAPAGYTCMTCSAPIIPSERMSSPIAEELKKFLATQSWAQPPKIQASEIDEGLQVDGKLKKVKAKDRKEGHDPRDSAREGSDSLSTGTTSSRSQTNQTSSIIGVSSRKGAPQTSVIIDSDEDKYKQRSGPASRLFWSMFGGVSSTGRVEVVKWKVGLAILLLVGVLVLLHISSSNTTISTEGAR